MSILFIMDNIESAHDCDKHAIFLDSYVSFGFIKHFDIAHNLKHQLRNRLHMELNCL